MKKAMAIFSAVLLAAASFLSAAHAQTPEKGSKNTMNPGWRGDLGSS